MANSYVCEMPETWKKLLRKEFKRSCLHMELIVCVCVSCTNFHKLSRQMENDVVSPKQ